jgi:hypothetical protein
MADPAKARNGAKLSGDRKHAAKLAENLERRREELIVFRDAGVLTEAELEEQMAKLRWGLP